MRTPIKLATIHYNCPATPLRLSPFGYGGPGQKSPEYSALGQIIGLCPCKLQGQSGTRLAGQPSRLGCDPYIYSGSQRVCAILIRCFSGPSASEAL